MVYGGQGVFEGAATVVWVSTFGWRQRIFGFHSIAGRNSAVEFIGTLVNGILGLGVNVIAAVTTERKVSFRIHLYPVRSTLPTSQSTTVAPCIASRGCEYDRN